MISTEVSQAHLPGRSNKVRRCWCYYAEFVILILCLWLAGWWYAVEADKINLQNGGRGLREVLYHFLITPTFALVIISGTILTFLWQLVHPSGERE